MWHKNIPLIALWSLIAFAAEAQKITPPPNNPADWSKEYKPFRIAGNLYYVGTYDLACYLIATPKGSILINTGLAESASMIRSNIEALGFRFSDVKILLTMQAHYDHMGAMATIKEMTGAKVMIDEKDAGVVADGGASDYALGAVAAFTSPLLSTSCCMTVIRSNWAMRVSFYCIIRATPKGPAVLFLM